MVTVRFKNNSGRSVEVIHQGATFVFAGGCDKTEAFAEGEVTERFLKSVKRRFPAIQISLVDEKGEDSSPLSDGTQGNPEANQTPKEGEELSFEKFAEKVLTKDSTAGGWWTLEVEGLEKPIKVQAGKDNEAKAVEMAFAEYCEAVDEQ